MKELNFAFKFLQKHGFVITRGNGSRGKIIPPDRDKPFYSIHINDKAFHPLRRFAKNFWGIDLEKI